MQWSSSFTTSLQEGIVVMMLTEQTMGRGGNGATMTRMSTPGSNTRHCNECSLCLAG